jgi:hypothetical protein
MSGLRRAPAAGVSSSEASVRAWTGSLRSGTTATGPLGARTHREFRLPTMSTTWSTAPLPATSITSKSRRTPRAGRVSTQSRWCASHRQFVPDDDYPCCPTYPSNEPFPPSSCRSPALLTAQFTDRLHRPRDHANGRHILYWSLDGVLGGTCSCQLVRCCLNLRIQFTPPISGLYVVRARQNEVPVTHHSCRLSILTGTGLASAFTRTARRNLGAVIGGRTAPGRFDPNLRLILKFVGRAGIPIYFQISGDGEWYGRWLFSITYEPGVCYHVSLQPYCQIGTGNPPYTVETCGPTARVIRSGEELAGDTLCQDYSDHPTVCGAMVSS